MSEKKVTFLNINEKIVDGIKKTANEGAVDRVVEKRVEAEVTRRADLLEKALDKYNTAKKELEKCKPDMISHIVVDDVPVKQEAWSDKALQAKQKVQKLIADFDVAIMKAFTEGDYKKLQELIGNGNQKPASKDESAE